MAHGIPAVNVPALSAEQHWAEKLHAYTLPRGGATNSRVKDLVELAMLIEGQVLRTAALQEAVRAMFKRRETHAIPVRIPTPPISWERPFAVLARECGMAETAESAHVKVAQYWQALRAEQTS